MDWFLYDNGLRHERVKMFWSFTGIYLEERSRRTELILKQLFWLLTHIFTKNRARYEHC